MPRIAAAKRDQYTEARRDQILGAALKVFAGGGFGETSVQAIADKAGLAKGSLYLYFPTKKALLEALVRRHAMLPELPDLIDAVKDRPPRVAIPMLAEQIWSRLKKRKALARVVLREIQSHPERGRVFYEQVAVRAAHLLAGYLRMWMRRGKLRRMDAVSAAQCFFGMLWNFLVTQELMGGGKFHRISDRRIVSTVSEIFLDGAARR